MKLHFCIILLTFLTFTSTAQPLATDFTITNALNDEEVELYANYLNQGKTVVIYIFFTNCPPCNSIASLVADLYLDWGNGMGDVEFIALSTKMYDSNGDVAVYHDSKNYPFPGAGYDGGGWDAANIYTDGTFGFYLGTPTFIVIAPDGTVNYDVRGSSRPETIEMVDQAIADTGAEKLDNVFALSGNVSFNGEGVAGTRISIIEANNGGVATNNEGAFNLSGILFDDETYHLNASKNTSPLNGVSTLDMILITKHILGIEHFDDPLQYIAADVNRSGHISTLDIIKIRKIILNIDQNFSDNTSWRFIPKDAVISNQNEPFVEFENHETTGIAFDVNSDLSSFEFEAVKVGDVDYSANPARLLTAGDRTGKAFDLVSQNQVLETGKWYEIDLKTSESLDLAGYQMTIEFDPAILEWVRATEGDLENHSLEQFNLKNVEQGWLSTNWVKATGQYLPKGASIMKLHFIAQNEAQLKDVLAITSSKTKAEIYTSKGDIMDLQLTFDGPTVEQDLQLFPNPLKDISQVVYYLKESTPVQLTILNAKGQLLKVILDEEQGVGWQSIDVENMGLARGMYWIRLNKGKDAVESLSFMVY